MITHEEVYPPEPVKTEPPIHCRGCGRQAPMKLSDRPRMGNCLGFNVLMPDTTGWMIILFPWKDLNHHSLEGRDPLAEAYYLCPDKCAQTVMGTLVHLATPGATR